MQPSKTHMVEHLFRNEYGKVISVLTGKYGVHHLETVEDAVQEAFLKAMKLWGYTSVPNNPTGWLLTVANNAVIDSFRKGQRMTYVDLPLGEDKGAFDSGMTAPGEVSDSQLQLIFACCHPSLTQEHQLILSLKLMGGFSNKELADALLKKEETVAKSFTRAKKKFRDQVKFLSMPVQMGLQSRLFVVLRVIYLLFSEGYSTTAGTSLVKRDICYEALRLALLLRRNKYCQHPQLDALIALMCFHAARFEARLNKKGEMVPLEYHDRSKYDKELIAHGLRHFNMAWNTTERPSSYHLEAAISLEHSKAATFDETDWVRILKLYDRRLLAYGAPVVALNRIVVLAKVQGAKKALDELNHVETKGKGGTTALFYAVKADLLKQLGKTGWKAALKEAMLMTDNTLMKKHLEGKLRD